MRVSALAEKARYGVLTPEIVSQICQKRLLAADLLAHSTELKVQHAAFMVRETVASIEAELLELIQ